MDELLARASRALPALMRGVILLDKAIAAPSSERAVAVAGALRAVARALEDAADALEEWGELAKLREGRFRGRGR